MIELAVTVMITGSILLVLLGLTYQVFESLGYVRPGLREPKIRILKLKKGVPDFDFDGSSVVFNAPSPILLAAEGGRDIIDTGYYVTIPVGYCGILVVRTESYRDSNGTNRTDIGTGKTFLAPGFSGPVSVEIWNKDFEEPAGMNAGLPFAELHLVPVPTGVKVVDRV